MAMSDKSYGEASTGQRFWTYLLDMFFITVATVAVAVAYALVATALDGPAVSLDLLAILVAFGYYVLQEAFLGRTLGKMIIGTRVIGGHGGQPTMKEVLIRTLIRFVPLEPFSFFGAGGWHDRWSNTAVVSTRPAKWQRDDLGD